MSADLADTLRAALAGEEWAVATLWRELNPPLLRFLRARDRLAADDVASETWLRVTRDLHTFRGADEAALRAWFFAVARHTLIDWQRRARRRPAAAWDDGALAEREAADDPAADAVDRIDTDQVMALIARLPADQADVLGKRPGTVRVLQHRALRTLAALLGAPAPQDHVTR